MITPFNQAFSDSIFPLPDTLKTVGDNGIKVLDISKILNNPSQVGSVTREVSELIENLLGYMPKKNEIVVYTSGTIWQKLTGIKKDLGNCEVGSTKRHRIIMLGKSEIYSIPASFFTTHSEETLQNLKKEDIEKYLCVEDVIHHLPLKYEQFENIISLLSEFDPEIIEFLGGAEKIKKHLESKQKKYSKENMPGKIPPGNLRALVYGIYLNLKKIDTPIISSPESIKRCTIHLRNEMRKSISPDFIAELPKLKKNECPIFTDRYADIQVVNKESIKDILGGYAIKSGEIILELDVGCHPIAGSIKSKQIFELYPNITAVLCRFNHMLFRFTRDVEGNSNPMNYKIWEKS